MYSSGQCCGSGSGIRYPVTFWPLDPDLGSRIPNPYFLELSDKFLGKKFYHSLKTGPNFFLRHFRNKIIFNFMKFVAPKKGMTTNFFITHFFEVFGTCRRIIYLGSSRHDVLYIRSWALANWSVSSASGQMMPLAVKWRNEWSKRTPSLTKT